MERAELKDRIYHVHTYRCGHAEDIAEELYVKRAIELGAKELSFSDHTPIPGDLFNYEMKMSELPGYVEVLKGLREKYAGQIELRIGLEVEYLPAFDDFFRSLKEEYSLDFLLLGQHVYEADDGTFSFFHSAIRKDHEDVSGLGGGIVKGIETGLFEAVAHPDRIFRRVKEWDAETEAVSRRIIAAAMKQGIPLEKNMESRKYDNLYWKEFWDLVPEECEIIYGVDAHSRAEMTENWHTIHGIMDGTVNEFE